MYIITAYFLSLRQESQMYIKCSATCNMFKHSYNSAMHDQ